ncbi:MAG: hypothetical protein HC827_19855 [Cyanobacteria bacterium RM1_2_2]|nr:hypothetical protein [Cyanobacteria bacterium RM1_2_2]
MKQAKLTMLVVMWAIWVLRTLALVGFLLDFCTIFDFVSLFVNAKLDTTESSRAEYLA